MHVPGSSYFIFVILCLSLSEEHLARMFSLKTPFDREKHRGELKGESERRTNDGEEEEFNTELLKKEGAAVAVTVR